MPQVLGRIESHASRTFEQIVASRTPFRNDRDVARVYGATAFVECCPEQLRSLSLIFEIAIRIALVYAVKKGRAS